MGPLRLDWLRAQAEKGDFILTQHAEIERQADELTLDDLQSALSTCELLEDYPEDPRGHSCLLLGFAPNGRPLHVVCGRSGPDVLCVITVYIPEPPKWPEPRRRSQT
jgi:hypothetical protein